ncbi:PhzF family phenazine biosynthesis protein [Microbacterium terricola]|uniref:Oxidoreductase n=1 Tax=Microbacterium terricola TaxID=344163 RepID=A0ABM8E2K2_9MICO|nr:PhzF family phenazine biosynthesis protein [Microbacterium terricola]UYK40285.1 PhzF family phenazine biosynthesis protein [Microbacterium terricola]BDV32002.1 oxidoreductase [Microbacterium terricola]
MPEVLRYAAFIDPSEADGGNPAGVVLDADGLDDAEMQRIAADVGYAETAFLVGQDGAARRIRYYSPIAEVPFCGHATIATAVVLAEREGAGLFRFATPVGDVPIETIATDAGIRATFTSVDPVVSDLAPDVREALLALLGLSESDLDGAYGPRIARAGNPHPVLVIADRARFDGFSFDPVAVRSLMDEQGWTGTVTVMHRDPAGDWEARNLFPVGAITEDPATGSAAASFGGYLRALRAVPVGETTHVRIRQGRHVGRPCLLEVEIPPTGGIRVSGSAAAL